MLELLAREMHFLLSLSGYLELSSAWRERTAMMQGRSLRGAGSKGDSSDPLGASRLL